MRLKEKETWHDGGYIQWFEHQGVTIRIHTEERWDELKPRDQNYYTERAEEYFRVRHHTDLGRIVNEIV